MNFVLSISLCTENDRKENYVPFNIYEYLTIAIEVNIFPFHIDRIGLLACPLEPCLDCIVTQCDRQKRADKMVGATLHPKSASLRNMNILVLKLYSEKFGDFPVRN